MSKIVDERIVKMEFENRSFEKNAAQSMDTLDKIDEKLKFKNGRKGFEEVEKAAEKTNFSTLIKAADVVTSKLSALEVVGITALQNITNRAIYAGEQLTRSLSIDQITAGYSKYEQKTANVQTILNSTQKSMSEVDKYLEKLMWYSDETSYSFTEMLNSYSTMLASGGDSKNLLSVITGIGNAVSYAGKGASELNSVLRYSINQAYSKGYLLTQDYQTLQTMNVDNEKLRQSFIDAAKELKLLDESGRILGDRAGEIVTTTNLPSTLAKKWLTKEVMEKAFGYWAEYSDAVYNATKVTKKFASTKDAMDALKDQYSQISVAGFEAGQNAKTFGEAIDAIKDAVSTGWMNTFELIFGKINEAIDLWGNLYDFLYPIFVEGGEKRNSWLSQILDGNEALIKQSSFMKEYDNIFLNDMSGRQMLHTGIFNILNGILDRVLSIRDAWNNIFTGPTIEEGRRKLQEFFSFSEKFEMTEEQGKRIVEVFEKLFKPIKRVTDFLKSTGKAVFTFGKQFTKFIGYFLQTDELKDLFSRFKGYFDFGSVLDSIIEKIKKITKFLNELTNTEIAEYAKKAGKQLGNLKNIFKAIYWQIKPFADNAGSYIKSIWSSFKMYIVEPVKNFLSLLVHSKNPIKTFFGSIKSVGIKDTFAKLFGYADFEEWKNNVENAFNSIEERINSFSKKVKEKVSELNLGDILSSGLAVVSGYSIFKFASAGDKIGDLAKSIKKTFDRINILSDKGKVKRFSVNMLIISSSIFKIAVAIAGLGALYSKFGASMWNATGILSVLTVLMAGVTAGFVALSKVLKEDRIKAFITMTDMIRKIANSMLILSIALAIASKNIPETFGQVINIISEFAGMAGILLGMTFLLTKFSGQIGVSIIAVIGIASALAIMGIAIGKIQNIQLTDTGKVLLELGGAVSIIVSILSMFSKAKNNVPSRMIGLLAAIGSIVGIIIALKEIASLPKENMLVNFGILVSLFLGVIALGKVLDIAIKSFDASWKDMLSLSIGLAAVTGCVYMMTKMFMTIANSGIKNQELWDSARLVFDMALIAGLLIVALGFAQKLSGSNHNFLKIAVSLYSIVGVMVAMAVLIKAIEAIKLYNNTEALITIGIMTLVISLLPILIGTAAYIGNGKGVGYLLGIVSVLTVISMIIIILSKLQSPELTSAMQQVIILMGVLAGVILAIGIAIRIAVGNTFGNGLSASDPSSKASPVANILTAAIVIGGMITAILLLRDKIKNYQDLIKIGIVVAGILASIFVVIGVLSLLNKTNLNSLPFKKMALFGSMIIAIGGAVALIGLAMKMMKDVPLEGFGKKLLIISGVIFGLSLVMAGIAALSLTGIGTIGMGAAILAFISMSMAIYTFGDAITKLSRVNLVEIGKGLLEVAPAFGKLGLAGIEMIPGAIGVIAFAGAIGLLGLASGATYLPIVKLLIVLNTLANFMSAIGTAFQTEGNIADKLAAISPALEESNAKSKQYAEELGSTIPETTAENIEDGEVKIEESLASVPEIVSDQLDDVKEVVQEEVTDIVDTAVDTANKEIEKKEKSGGLFGKAKDKVIGALGNVKQFTIEKITENLGIPDIQGLLGGTGEYRSLGNLGSNAADYISEKIGSIENSETFTIHPIIDMDDNYSWFSGLFQDGNVYEPVIRPKIDMSNPDSILQKAQSIANSKNSNSVNNNGLFDLKNALSSFTNGINSKPTNITMNIYGSPDQDVDELADIIMTKMNDVYIRKAGVFR